MDTMTGFKVGKWVDRDGVPHDNFCCDSCQFSTLDLDKMREHQFHEEHRWPFPEGRTHSGMAVEGGK